MYADLQFKGPCKLVAGIGLSPYSSLRVYCFLARNGLYYAPIPLWMPPLIFNPRIWCYLPTSGTELVKISSPGFFDFGIARLEIYYRISETELSSAEFGLYYPHRWVNGFKSIKVHVDANRDLSLSSLGGLMRNYGFAISWTVLAVVFLLVFVVFWQYVPPYGHRSGLVGSLFLGFVLMPVLYAIALACINPNKK
jgi:hypothetical protein